MTKVLRIHDTLEGVVAASHTAVEEGPDAVVSGLTGDDRSMFSNKGAIFSPWGWEVGASRHNCQKCTAPQPITFTMREG